MWITMVKGISCPLTSRNKVLPHLWRICWLSLREFVFHPSPKRIVLFRFHIPTYHFIIRPKRNTNVWNCYTLSKIYLFWWSSLHGSILTTNNIKWRGFQLVNWYILCKNEEETICNLLIHYPYAKAV